MTSGSARLRFTRPAPSANDVGGLGDDVGGRTIALVGNPNVGKSTLFNAVTGSKQDTVNAPGTTVEVTSGRWRTLGARVLDLPGTYSLVPASPDEKVVSDTLAGVPGSLTDPATNHPVDLVVAVLDGGSLTRSLYLLGQIAQTGLAVCAVITMADVAEANGQRLDSEELSDALGIPVLLFDAREKSGYSDLDAMVGAALEARPHIRGLNSGPAAPGYPAAAIHAHAETCTCGHDHPDASVGGEADSESAHSDPADLNSAHSNSADAASAMPSTCSCGHSPVSSLDLDATLTSDSADLDRASELFSWVESVERKLHGETAPTDVGETRSDKADRVLLNPVVGPIVFLAIMWFLFKVAGEWIGPIQDWFDALFSSTQPGAFSLANGITWLLGALGWDASWLESLLVGGLATGLGVVASFIPLILVIFVAISILEDSGYMARAAFLGDRLMRKIGLDGRVILPLIMGFGCNVPALSATRSLPNSTQRLITVLITPYTSCAARLTIYLMIGKIFFPNQAGTVVFSLYLISVLFVIGAAWVLKHVFRNDSDASPLMLVLPAYQVPRVALLLQNAARRTWQFVKSAGKIIVIMTMVVWALGAIPAGAGAQGKSFADPTLAMEDSVYGQIAKGLEPVFEPAGFGDWHMTGALMTGFVAKETVVSSIVTSYNMDPAAAGDAESNGDNLGVLPELLTTTFTQTAGAPYMGLAAYAFMVFVLSYTPCLATVAEQARLIGGKRTAIAVGVQLVVAWVVAVAIFQIGKLVMGVVA